MDRDEINDDAKELINRVEVVVPEIERLYEIIFDIQNIFLRNMMSIDMINNGAEEYLHHNRISPLLQHQRSTDEES